MCESKFGRYYVGFLTVLDVDGWVSTKGKNKGEVIGKNQRLLLPLKTKSLKRYNIIKKKKTSLVGAMFDLTRTDENAPTCGDMFDFIETVDLDDEKYWYESKLEKKMKAPEVFDYLKLFKPMSRGEMAAIGRGASAPSKKKESSDGENDYEGDGDSGGGDKDTLY